MGILDGFLDDPQQAGLLNAAAQMLQASGPSLMPRSFGQVMGAGIGGFQEGAAMADKRALQNQLRQLNGYKLKDAESDLLNQEAKRKRDQDVQKAGAEFWTGGAVVPPTFLAGQPAAQMMGGMVSGSPMQAQPQEQAPQAGGRNATPYQQRMAFAQFLRSKGFGPEAQAEEDSALKLQPKVKGWEKVQQGGKVMFAPFFEDGTSGAPVPLEVAEKLEFQNTGKQTLGLNPFTGAPVTKYDNTMSPAEAAANGIAGQRLTLERDRFNYEKGQGKIPAGYRWAADGTTLEAIPGGPAADKVTNPQQKLADAKDVIALLDQAEPLVKKATGSYGGVAADAAARFFGQSTDGAEAAAQLKVLEGNLVAKQPKMSGPQSDKDVAMYKQMAGVIGDPTVPKETKLAAMATIREISNRYINGMPAAAAPKPGAGKVATLADIAATAKASGKTTAEVTKALREQGYTIKGN